MSMDMPKISITFTSLAQSAVKRSQAGTVGVILKDAAASGALALRSASEIPSGLTAGNQAYLQRAFAGYVNAPGKVLCYVLAADAADLSAALAWMSAQDVDYLCCEPEVTASECTAVATWVKAQRADNHAHVKAILPNTASDSEAVINFTSSGITVGAATYGAADYCSRIAGMLAGTPTTYSCTYAPLAEVSDVTRMTQAEQDAAVAAGKLILFWDGKQARVGRAVNSLTTVTSGKSESWKKIKLVEAMDMIDADLRELFAETYIGKFPNSYDNKLVVLTEVRNYVSALVGSVLQTGFSAELDAAAQRAWLEANGTDTSGMTDAEVLQANTGSKVFLTASGKILDAIEDIALPITI